MNWRDVKWLVNSLPDSELGKAAKFYDPYFKRTVDIHAIDHLSMVENGDPSDHTSDLVLIGSTDRT